MLLLSDCVRVCVGSSWAEHMCRVLVQKSGSNQVPTWQVVKLSTMSPAVAVHSCCYSLFPAES